MEPLNEGIQLVRSRLADLKVEVPSSAASVDFLETTSDRIKVDISVARNMPVVVISVQ